MKRMQLLQLLHNYHPVRNEEKEAKSRMIAFVERHEDCFERSLAPGHITASSWLLNNDGSKALLMHHAKLDLWVQLGGHCDGDSDVLAVALKEAQEESGINGIVPVQETIFDIDIHMIPATATIPAHEHYDVRFLLKVASSEEITQNRESKELRWIEKKQGELPTAQLSVVRLFDKWLAL